MGTEDRDRYESLHAVRPVASADYSRRSDGRLDDRTACFLLDAGCGSGMCDAAIAEAGHCWLGTDISEPMDVESVIGTSSHSYDRQPIAISINWIPAEFLKHYPYTVNLAIVMSGHPQLQLGLNLWGMAG